MNRIVEYVSMINIMGQIKEEAEGEKKTKKRV